MDSFRMSTSTNGSEAHSMQEFDSSKLKEGLHPLVSTTNSNNSGGNYYTDTADNLAPPAKRMAVSPGQTPRQTAQMSFEVASEPSSTKQLRALIVKNFKVRTRDIAQTV